MNQEDTKPTVLWILQNNQVTPIILEFLKILKKGLGKINLQFMVPGSNQDVLEMVQVLEPTTFQAALKKNENYYENFSRKRNLLHDTEFTDGLKVWRALVLDDFGGGFLSETKLQLPPLKNVKAIILQIPTPLGSLVEEEMIFIAWVHLAHNNNIPIAGYELLPLDTKWTLIPSILDGIITNRVRSYEYLSDEKQKIKGKIWKLPRNEGKSLRPGTSNLWQNGLQAPYHYRIELDIPKEKSILFIPHNVAMSYEYRRLLEEIEEFGDQLHLMFCIGKDQVRGTHSHEEIIKTISSKTLENFHSYSFHDINCPWEMVMADALLACSHCFSTTLAENNGIPCYVMDDSVPPGVSGYLTVTNQYSGIRKLIQHVIDAHNQTTDIVNIIYELISGNISKIKV